MTSPITLVNDITPRDQRTGDGSTVAFAFSWPIRSSSDVVVLFGADPADIAYNIAGSNDDAGFTITFTSAPLTGTVITVYRDMADEYQTDFTQQGKFNAATVNAEFADGAMRLLQLKRDLARGVKLPTDDALASMDIPPLADRASKYLGFDADGVMVPLASSNSVTFDIDSFGAAAALSSTDQAPISQGGVNKVTDLGTLATWLNVAASGLPIITTSIAGLAGDYDGALNTGTDDGPALQRAIDTYSALYGGALFMLAAQPGKGFYFAGSPRCKTNVKLLFTSPVALAPKAGLKIRGELAQVVGTAGYYLTADAASGQPTMTVDTTPSGGGAVNAHFSAGDLVYATGLLDSAGTPLEDQELVVASATTTTVTFTKNLGDTFQATYAAGSYEAAWATANKSILRKVRTATLSGSVTEGTNILAVTAPTLARIAVGDLVIIEDDSIQSDIRGSGNGRVAREQAKILAIGEGGATNVRLSRRLGRAYSTSYNARLTVVTPAKGCSIQGASVTFTAAADASPWPTFEMRWCDGCTIAGCSVPNLDSYGSRGNGFRVDLCHECNIEECSVASPKYYASGEGYGIYITHSTGCGVTNSQMTGCRHAYIWLGATDCDNRDCRSTACLLSDFDFHGAAEYGCTIYNPEVTGGSVSASSTLSAFAFGNSTGLVNPRYCGVAGGTVENYQSSLSYCVRFEAGASNCFVRNTRFHNIYQALFHSDTSGFTSLASTNCIFENNVVDGCTDWCLYLDGGAAGSTNKTAVGLLVKGNTFRTVGKMVYVNQLDKLLLQDNTFDLITPDVSYTYAFNLAVCTNLQVVRNRANGASRGIKLTTCPSALVAINVLSNQVNSTAIDWSAGGSTGAVIVGNVYLGFVATFGRDTTGGVLEWPRATAITIADQAVYKLQPLDASGRVYVFKDSAITPRIGVAYWAGATPACAALTTNGAVAAATGVLTGTTGTPGNLTVSAASDGYIYVENRSGGSLNISVIWDA